MLKPTGLMKRAVAVKLTVTYSEQLARDARLE